MTINIPPPVQLGASFPAPLQCLFEPKRYKVLYGGRSAGRSWGVSRALLIMATKRRIKVLCVREFQKSIEESVHAVLSEQIEKMGLGPQFTVLKHKIIHNQTGSEFFFEGIKNNPTKIKSYEGIDYCWAEEAVKISRASWQILIPTIRKEVPENWRELGLPRPDFQSEIWMTFNPELEDDYTYKHWVKSKKLKQCLRFYDEAGDPLGGIQESEDAFVVKMTYRDNPWLPMVMHQEILKLQEEDPDLADNIYGGNILQMLEGVVYARELRRVVDEGRVCDVPWEPELPVDCFWDLGRADHTCIWFGQFVGMQFRVVDFLDGRGEDITFYLKELQQRGYVYGTMFLPHDAKHKRLVYKHSIEKIVRDRYPDTRVMPALKVSDSINNARLFFRKCFFDEEKCADGLAALRRYKYKIKDGQGTPHPTYSTEPEHGDDGSSDAADAFEIMAQAAGTPRGTRAGVRARLQEAEESARAKGRSGQAEVLGRLRGGLGWMG